MKQYIRTFLGTYIVVAGSLWSIVEAYTYFRGDELKQLIGNWWLLVFIVFPLLAALVVTIVTIIQTLRKQQEALTAMTDAQLMELLRSDKFTYEDISTKLVPDLGYSVPGLAGPNPTKPALANQLVIQAVSDGKRALLIQKIRFLKDYLQLPPDA